MSPYFQNNKNRYVCASECVRYNFNQTWCTCQLRSGNKHSGTQYYSSVPLLKKECLREKLDFKKGGNSERWGEMDAYCGL